jgi:hypothetical protein
VCLSVCFGRDGAPILRKPVLFRPLFVLVLFDIVLFFKTSYLRIIREQLSSFMAAGVPSIPTDHPLLALPGRTDV